jgi:hypothetical protein
MLVRKDGVLSFTDVGIESLIDIKMNKRNPTQFDRCDPP